jgi:hypothetical protein
MVHYRAWAKKGILLFRDDVEAGHLWALSAADAVPSSEHARRLGRYIELNPTRAGIVRDPLSWPWSTHRDRCGLVAHPVVAVSRDPVEWHRYVSSDPTVAVEGTAMPEMTRGTVNVAQIAAAVSCASRLAPGTLRTRGTARSAFVRAAFAHGTLESFDAERLLGVDGRTRVGWERYRGRG